MFTIHVNIKYNSGDSIALLGYLIKNKRFKIALEVLKEGGKFTSYEQVLKVKEGKDLEDFRNYLLQEKQEIWLEALDQEINSYKQS